jgi:hypothetical protein
MYEYGTGLWIIKGRPDRHISYSLHSKNTGERFLMNTIDNNRSFLFSNISLSWAQDHMGCRLQDIIFRLFLTGIQYMSDSALSHLRVSLSSMTERVTSLLLYQKPRDSWVWKSRSFQSQFGGGERQLLISDLPQHCQHLFIYLVTYLFSISRRIQWCVNDELESI